MVSSGNLCCLLPLMLRGTSAQALVPCMVLCRLETHLCGSWRALLPHRSRSATALQRRIHLLDEWMSGLHDAPCLESCHGVLLSDDHSLLASRKNVTATIYHHQTQLGNEPAVTPETNATHARSFRHGAPLPRRRAPERLQDGVGALPQGVRGCQGPLPGCLNPKVGGGL